MLFSSPQYPLFLAAVFLLYGLARAGRWPAALARVALMTLLGDLIYLLLCRDTTRLWDPLGGLFYPLVTGHRGGGLDLASLSDYLSTVVDANAHDLAHALVPVPFVSFGDVLPAWWHLLVGAPVLAGAVVLGARVGGRLEEERFQRGLAAAGLALVGSIGVALVATYACGGVAAIDRMSAVLSRGGHLAYLVVLGVALGAASTTAGRTVGRVLILFLVSMVFYHAWASGQTGAYKYLLALLGCTILLDFYLARWIEDSDDPALRKLLLLVSLVSNLGILVFFKYAAFFTGHAFTSLNGLILPAGISFHTFQSLSYTIDVYRKEIRATRSPIELATFVLFFPQLVAGPIVRAVDLLPQLHTLPAFDHGRAADGLYRIVVGLFKKIALADFLAVALADRVFAHPERYSSVEVAAGIYAYAFQIYLDFSAYSDIAIGSAQLLGFHLPENFRTPYRSASLQEFWRRWHMSLSTWLRDYLYIPLGGSRGGSLFTYRNLILTMLLGGLWHGANWTFIVWGLLHGGGLAVTRAYQRRVERHPEDARRMLAWCAAVALGGVALHLLVARAFTSPWTDLVLAWAYLVPLWAVLTAWLAGGEPPVVTGRPKPGQAMVLRGVAGVALALLFLTLHGGPRAAWVPLVIVVGLATWAADLATIGPLAWTDVARWLTWAWRRALSMVLVFHYVCLAWVFFRARSFGNALAVLRRLGAGEWDAPNLSPAIVLALVAAL
ncbi:MAG TPA: MBOAT family O-acyltransferase, partial [Kofleriaceae bacterium]|nr:MBOAT family O-acyltransferase [Kofleriaceae bacterium]